MALMRSEHGYRKTVKNAVMGGIGGSIFLAIIQKSFILWSFTK
jgi:hypothetical protein